MRFPLHQLAIAFLLGILPRPAEAQSTLGDIHDEINAPPQIRWASSGGGWRAMFASIGFANVFQQAGLFSQNSSKLSAISTNSGSSWFSTQLFYSDAFYNQTVMAKTPQELYDFTARWMGTYEALSDYVIEDTGEDLCNTTDLGNSTGIEVFGEVCELLLQYSGDWALLVATMLLVASGDYGDPLFVNRTATAANRIPPLQKTDLYIMASISPASRVRSVEKVPIVSPAGSATNKQFFGEPDDTLMYLGPPDDDDQLYTTVQGVTYVVSSADGEGFYYMSDSKTSQDFQLYKGSTAYDFAMRDFDQFFLYQDTPGTVTIGNPRFGGGDVLVGENFRPPFGGNPTVVQVASISSAAGASMSPASPIAYAQILSKAWAGLAESLGPLLFIPGRILFNRAVNRIYQAPTFDNFAVCSQWPDNCGGKDGFFLDGGFVENLALSATISQYQLQASANIEKPLKVLLTNTNQDWETYEFSELLMYFESPFNDGIAPGGHLSVAAKILPLRSPQLFEEFMDVDSLNEMVEPIPGSNITTILARGLTTIDNAVYGIENGLTVDLLLINLNEPITTFIVGPSVIRNTTQPLAEMVQNIAGNDVLVQRVRDFYELE